MKKKILIIMRSIFTSFLFLILIPIIFFQIILTSVQVNNISILESVEIDTIKTKLNIQNYDQNYNTQIDEYIKMYLKYLFIGGSFPNLRSNNYSIQIDNIIEKIDIEYSKVLNIRNLTSLLYNNSVYLIVNFLIFVIFIIIVIIYQNFTIGIKKFSFFLVVISLISLASFLSIYLYIKNKNTFLSFLILNIIDNHYFNSIINISLIYIGLFFVIYLLIKMYLIKELKKKTISKI